MKRVTNILVIAAMLFSACSKSLTPEETATVMNIISSQQFTFKAQTANPLAGRNIQLTPGYDLQVNNNIVTATLPYYGKAYTPPLDPSQIGIKFTSNRFRYSSTTNTKGDWEVLIIPEDVPDVQQLRLSISAEGYATLYVTNTNRQAISYYGYISKNKVATEN